MIHSLRSAQKALPADESPQTKNDTRLISDPILQQLQIRSNILSPRADINEHGRIIDRRSRACDPTGIGRWERQSREILR
jgi:hypothetical protein